MIVTYVVFTELHCGKTATPISFLFGSSLQKTTLLDVFFTLCEQKSLPFEMAADIVLSCFFFCFFLVFFFLFFFPTTSIISSKRQNRKWTKCYTKVSMYTWAELFKLSFARLHTRTHSKSSSTQKIRLLFLLEKNVKIAVFLHTMRLEI